MRTGCTIYQHRGVGLQETFQVFPVMLSSTISWPWSLLHEGRRGQAEIETGNFGAFRVELWTSPLARDFPQKLPELFRHKRHFFERIETGKSEAVPRKPNPPCSLSTDDHLLSACISIGRITSAMYKLARSRALASAFAAPKVCPTSFCLHSRRGLPNLTHLSSSCPLPSDSPAWRNNDEPLASTSISRPISSVR